MPAKQKQGDIQATDSVEQLKNEIRAEMEAEIRAEMEKKVQADKKAMEEEIRIKIADEAKAKQEKIDAEQKAQAEKRAAVMEEKKDADLKKFIWTPEARTVVTAMKHPGFNDEVGVSIRTFETELEARNFARDLDNLDPKNQMSLLNSSNYAWYGIERRTVNGIQCVAQTSNPFAYRIQKFVEETQKIDEADTGTIGKLTQQINSLQQQLNQVQHLTNINSPEHAAHIEQEQKLDERLQHDIEQSRLLEEGETSEDGATSSSRAL